jgi:hypothetical protein
MGGRENFWDWRQVFDMKDLTPYFREGRCLRTTLGRNPSRCSCRDQLKTVRFLHPAHLAMLDAEQCYELQATVAT